MLIEDFWAHMARLEVKARLNAKAKPQLLKLKLASCEEQINLLNAQVKALKQELDIVKTINKELMMEGDDLKNSMKKYKLCVLNILQSQGF